MMRRITAILLLVVTAFTFTYAAAGTRYDEFVGEIKKNQDLIDKYEKQNADLQAYLDAVASGDQEQWEAARKLAGVTRALLFRGDENEVDVIENQLKTNNSLIEYSEISIEILERKKLLYYKAVVQNDTEDVSAFLKNGLPTYPQDICDNLYLLCAKVEMEPGLLTDKEVIRDYTGDCYLVTAHVDQQNDSDTFVITINGQQARATFENGNPPVGQDVNIYFTPFIIDSDGLPYLVVTNDESEYDIYYRMRPRKEDDDV